MKFIKAKANKSLLFLKVKNIYIMTSWSYICSVGKVLIQTFITKDDIKIPASEGQQKDIVYKIGFSGTEIDSGTVITSQYTNYRVSSFSIHSFFSL